MQIFSKIHREAPPPEILENLGTVTSPYFENVAQALQNLNNGMLDVEGCFPESKSGDEPEREACIYNLVLVKNKDFHVAATGTLVIIKREW